MYKIFITLIIFIFAQNISFSAIRDFETTHLKSTAGAGVGSLLLEESSILNPAPIAFFNTSSIYFQKTGTQFNNENTSNPYDAPDSDIMAVIVSDTKGKAKGSISYIYQNEGYSFRRRISGSVSYLLGKGSAMGMTYKYTMDTIASKDRVEPIDKYQQITAGFSHIIGPNTSVGVVFIDPLQKKANETRAIIGVQYNLQDFLSLMVDAGADYNQDLANTFLYKLAVQVKVYDNFFIRAGKFSDKGKQENRKWSWPELGWA